MATHSSILCMHVHAHTHTHTHLLPLCCGWQSPENIAQRSQNSSQESWMDDDRALYTKKYSNPCAYTKAFSFILTTYMSSPVSLIRKSFSIEWQRGQSHLVLTTYHALLKQPSSPCFFRMVLTSPSPPPTAVDTCRLPRAPTHGLLKENPCSRVTPCPAPPPPRHDLLVDSLHLGQKESTGLFHLGSITYKALKMWHPMSY